MSDVMIGGVAQPGARSSRQENRATELELPAGQAGLRAGVDVLAVLLVMGALLVLGRWAIWVLVALFFFSDVYEAAVDVVLARLYGTGATVLEVALWLVKWLWIGGAGLIVLRLVVPVTWMMNGRVAIGGAALVPVWPFVMPKATSLVFPCPPLARAVLLTALVAPLFSWGPLRDRLKWSLWEFTPFGPIDVAVQGVDPHRWGPQPVPEPSSEGGVIFETTDYEPHTRRVAEGVYVSNGSGRSAVQTDMRWVTWEQWQEVARLLLIEGKPFSEEVLGRGRVFPTHGPFDKWYGAKLGFRFFREQLVTTQIVAPRGGHENAGYVLTEYGRGWLRERILEGEGVDDVE